MQPRDHRSAVWSYGFSWISSGHMYSGVPLIEVSTKVEKLMALANLKQDYFIDLNMIELILLNWSFRL